jgi:predicted ATP-grasp superfamily ATP-dependent carboligase
MIVNWTLLEIHRLQTNFYRAGSDTRIMLGYKLDHPATGELTSMPVDAPRHLTVTSSPPLAPSSRYAEVGALIIGGDHGSLAVARSLGRRGIPVCFISDDKVIAKFSRYTARSWAWAGPNHPDALNFLLDLAREYGLEGWVLFPAGDREVKLVGEHHAALSRVYRLYTQPWDVARTAIDKHLMYLHAAALGIGHPACYEPRSRLDVIELDCQFPMILKPSEKEGFNPLTQAKAWRIDNRAQLLAKYDEAVKLIGADHIVLQELIPGGGDTQFSYTGVWSGGAPVASMIARRTRQYPVEFGTGTYVESADNAEVEHAACVFLKSLDFNGMVEIEFKFDARDGRYKILDVNPRVWTWNALGELAGVDFPFFQWRLAMGETVAPSRGRAGAAWMYVPKDLMAATVEMFAGRLSPSDYLKSFKGPLMLSTFAADDLLPALVDLPRAIARFSWQRLFGI